MLEQLQKEKAEERIRCFIHPFLPLLGWNYTETCSFGKLWNETNIQCRGLITDLQGNVIARPFGKFFNLEELSVEQRTFDPKDIDYISTKEDGSLIIMFWYQDAWRFCTRGSFVSDQAILAEKLRSQNPSRYSANHHNTYLFELVGPSNRNVTRGYEVDELILLGVRDTQTGSEYGSGGIRSAARTIGVNHSKQWDWDAELFQMVKSNKDPNFEGLVVTMKSGLRFKLKSELYCQLHKVVTGEFTPSRVLDLWQSSKLSENWIDPVIPDEFYAEIREHVAKVEVRWLEYREEMFVIRAKASTGYSVMKVMNKADDRETRKFLATTLPESRPYLSILLTKGLYADIKEWETIAKELFIKKELA